MKIYVISVQLILGLLVCNAWKYSRDDFPLNFIFGSGTSAYQVEGAANEDGRTPCIWDTFAHAGFAGGYTGDIACDQYHKYKEDVQLMADIGLDAYRFSISWSRLIPNGRGPVNPKGLLYYNNLINELLSRGIQPHVTLVNLDHPQALEDEYGGWISRKMVDDFVLYADVCFREFGDRVKYWTTVNEPNIMGRGGYDLGTAPPARCSPPFGQATWICRNHNLCLLEYSFLTFKRRHHCYSTSQRLPYWLGSRSIGVWRLPRHHEKNAGSRIPSFTKLESELVKGSFDFIGIIHYTIAYVKDSPGSLMTEQRDYYADQAVSLLLPDPLWGFELSVNPWALEGVLEYIKQVYGNPPVFVYENGQRMRLNSSVEDTPRIEYLQAYIGSVLNALRNGSNTRGYVTWSFLDVFEIFGGYESTYGLCYVDFDDPDLKRYPKLSAHWYSRFLTGKTVDPKEVTIEFDESSSALSS